MNKATRYAVGILAIVLAIGGTIAFLQILMGERADSLALPAALVGGSGLGFWFALYFGTGLPAVDNSESDDDSLPSPVASDDHAA